jgi:4-amino-4-deoxy-L-arabinose transferase-like glycosyltransferase
MNIQTSADRSVTNIKRAFGKPFASQNYLRWILVLAAALRVGAAIWLPDQHLPDAEAYREMARNLRDLHTFSSPYHMPLYPLAIAIVSEGWPQLAFDIGLSTVTVWLIYDLTLSMFGDRRAALVAAGLAAIYPFFIFYAVVGLTETLFMTLTIAAFGAWYRGAFALAAIFTLLSILTRPTIELLPPFLILFFAIVIHHLPLRRALQELGVYALIYIFMLTPWWVRNYELYGTFVRLNLGAGLALYSGNNPKNTSGGVSDNVLDTSPFDSIADPVARDRAAQSAAFEFIKAHPQRFLKLAGRKFLRFWRLYPFAEQYRSNIYVVTSLLSFAPILLLAIVFVLSSNWGTVVTTVPLIAFIAYLTLIHMIIVGSIRYRLPIEPFLIVLGAPMLIKIYDYVRSICQRPGHE